CMPPAGQTCGRHRRLNSTASRVGGRRRARPTFRAGEGAGGAVSATMRLGGRAPVEAAGAGGGKGGGPVGGAWAGAGRGGGEGGGGGGGGGRGGGGGPAAGRGPWCLGRARGPGGQGRARGASRARGRGARPCGPVRVHRQARGRGWGDGSWLPPGGRPPG